MTASPRALTTLASLFASVFTPSAPALEWSFSPAVKATALYNDNLFLTIDSTEETAGVEIAPHADFAVRAPAWGLGGRAELRSTYYSNSIYEDTEDQILNLSYNGARERSRWLVNAAYTRDSTLESELSRTGIVNERRQSVLRSLAPTFSYDLIESAALNLSYNLVDVSYSDSADANLRDYTTHTGTVGISYTLTERDQLSFTLAYTDYETENADVQSDLYVAQVGLDHIFTETLRANLSVGARRTETTVEAFTPILPIGFTQITTTEESDGLIVAGSLEQQFRPDVLWRANVSRNITPTGRGGLVQTDQLGLEVRHEWSPRLSGSFNAALYNTEGVEEVLADLDRRFFSLGPRLRYALSERLSMDGFYQYAEQRFEVSDNDASANAVYLTLTYEWPKISVSR